MTGERGSITPMVPVLALVFLVLGGLIIDGSRDLNARGEAQAYAEEAARAGANTVDLTSNVLKVDEGKASNAVTTYCHDVERQNSAVTSCRFLGVTDTTTCNVVQSPLVVHTAVTLRIRTSLLGIIPGLPDLTASGQAKARPYEGLTAANAC